MTQMTLLVVYWNVQSYIPRVYSSKEERPFKQEGRYSGQLKNTTDKSFEGKTADCFCMVTKVQNKSTNVFRLEIKRIGRATLLKSKASIRLHFTKESLALAFIDSPNVIDSFVGRLSSTHNPPTHFWGANLITGYVQFLLLLEIVVDGLPSG